MVYSLARDGVPPRIGHQMEYLIRSWQYASCIHTGGLSYLRLFTCCQIISLISFYIILKTETTVANYEKILLFVSEFMKLQKNLKIFFYSRFRYALFLDWFSEEDAKSLPLLEFYTGLRWAERDRSPTSHTVELNSIYDIFKFIDKEPHAVNIYIEGKLE